MIADNIDAGAINIYGKKRYFLMALKNTARSILIMLPIFIRKNNFTITHSNADVVFLFPSKKSASIKRQAFLLEALAKIFVVDTHVLEKPNKAPLSQLSWVIAWPHHFIYAAYARYIMQKYAKCRVIINERYDVLFQYYLMKYKKDNQIIIQLAHAKLGDDSRLYAINLCNFYYVFGKSSMDWLSVSPYRIGDGKVIPVGAYFLNNSPAIPHYPSKKVIILGLGPEQERCSKVQEMYKQLDSFASSSRYQFFFKPHPRSEFGKKFFEKVFCFDPMIGIEYLSDALAVIAIFTNAVLDASSKGIPVVYYNPLGFLDKWELGSYFGVTDNLLSLEEKLNLIENEFEFFQKQAKKFSEYHLGDDGFGYNKIVADIAGRINSI